MLCAGCEKDFREDDVAPYLRYQDGTYALACRKCIGTWIQLGILWHTLPFWARKQGLDKL
jgi:hypothetical protein